MRRFNILALAAAMSLAWRDIRARSAAADLGAACAPDRGRDRIGLVREAG